MKSELEQNIWAVLGAKKVWIKDCTYSIAVKWRDVFIEQNPKLAFELTITTNDAAARFESQRKF